MQIHPEQNSFNRLNPLDKNLGLGLNLVGKLQLNGPQWIGKFA